MTTIQQIKTVRRRWLLGWHVFICGWIILIYAPLPNPQTQVVQGFPREYKRCARICDSGVQVGEAVLACAVDLLGHSYSCPNFYDPKKIATATYFVMPTVFSTIGISTESLILVRFEQDSKVTREKPYGKILSGYLLSTILLIIFLVGSFIQFRTLKYFKKEI